MDRTKETRRTLLVSLLLAAATFATYWPVLHHGFVYYDDSTYIYLNPHVLSGLSWENVKWAMTTGHESNWHPLTWLSHMLDAQLYGLNAGGHHLTNLLFHTANSLLLLLLLKRMTGALWRSAFVAALFALHPLHVESVAWVAERKDVLSAFFFMLTLLAYAGYVASGGWRVARGGNPKSEIRNPKEARNPKPEETNPETSGRKSEGTPEFKIQSSKLEVRSSSAPPPSILHPLSSPWYYAALFFFACGLMSKPMLVTLPFVLLLLDFWPLRRVTSDAWRGAGETRSEVRSAKVEALSSPPTTQEAGYQALQHSTTPLLRLLFEKLPFFVLSAASCVVTVVAQQRGGSVAAFELLPITDRIANAAVACMLYLRDTFWPAKLAVFYPHPGHWPAVLTTAGIALLLAVSVACLRSARRRPFALMGWLWYLGMLVPVIGLIQVGNQARADRYTYLPLIGIFILVSWGVGGKEEGRWQKAESRTGTEAEGPRSDFIIHTSYFILSLSLLTVLAITTRQQVRHWQNGRTLFEHAIKVVPDNYVAWESLGISDLERKDPVSALTNFTRALECARIYEAEKGYQYFVGAALQLQGRPLEALPYLEQAVVGPDRRAERSYRLGLSLMAAGRMAEAEASLREALEAKPDNVDFQLGMATLLQQQGQNAKAERLFRDIIASHPEVAEARKPFADFLLLLNRPAEAETQLAAAVKLQPQDINLRRAYSAALARQGKNAEATAQLEQVLKLAPANAQANLELADLLSQQGRNREAVAQYEKTLATDPKQLSALNNLAWLLATDPDEHIRNGARAVELGERACQLTEWKAPVLMGTLAAAYAEAGRFPDAVATAEKARDKARADKQEDVAKRNDELLELYKAGKPYREKL